jgi:hypothetical protein
VPYADKIASIEVKEVIIFDMNKLHEMAVDEWMNP